MQDEMNDLQYTKPEDPDIVRVVRCKDCKWSDWYETAKGEQYCYCMETGAAGRTEEDYCSYGERA